MTRTFEVCLDLDVEDVKVEAEHVFYSQETGWLVFSTGESSDPGGRRPVAVFAPGKWLYFQQVAK